MATTYPRTAITLKPDTKEVYAQYAKALGVPTSRAISLTLEQSSDVVKQLTEALEAAKSDKAKGLEKLNTMLDGSLDQAAENQVDIEEQIERMSGEK